MPTIKPFETIDAKYTRVHNYVLDEIMPRENKSTLCVLLVAIRCTVGWNKDTDRISISQFERKTGMTRNTVIRAIKTCLDRGYLLRFSDTSGNYFYTLNQDFEVEETEEGSAIIAPLDDELARLSRHPSAIIAPPLARLSRHPSAIIALPLARLSRPQKTESKTESKTIKDNNKNNSTAAKIAPVVVVDDTSPQAIIFSEFGIALNDTTRALLERPVTDIQAWINFARSQENLNNPAGVVIRGLQSGEQPPNGGEHETSRTRNHNATVNDKAIEISDRRRQRTIVL